MPHHDIKAVLFDKDGTLLDFHQTWAATNRAAANLAASGNPDLASRLLKLSGMDETTGQIAPDSLFASGNTAEIAEVWESAGALLAKPDLVRALDLLFVQAAHTAVPVTDLAGLFGKLSSAGYALGIASSDNQAAIETMVARFEIRRFISFIAGYDSGHGYKPGPGMLTAFCETVKTRPEQTAVVGDSLHDMEMARAGGAGLRIAVTAGSGSAPALRAASDICIGNVDELQILFARG